MHRAILPGALALTVALGCGDHTSLTADASGAGGDAGPATDTASAETIGSCAATCKSVDPPVGQPPYAIKFRFANHGLRPVYLRTGCILEYRISSCERCYQDDLGPKFGCGTCACADTACTGQGVACGPCQEDHGALVAPDAMIEDLWGGFALRPDARRGQCLEPLAGGYYGVEVMAYDSADDAVARRAGRPVMTTFALGSGNDVVSVELAAPADAGAP